MEENDAAYHACEPKHGVALAGASDRQRSEVVAHVRNCACNVWRWCRRSSRLSAKNGRLVDPTGARLSSTEVGSVLMRDSVLQPAKPQEAEAFGSPHHLPDGVRQVRTSGG